MGFLDAITIGILKKSQKGHWLFFPWGLFGQGYIIDSEQLYKILRLKIIIYYMLCIPFCILIIKFVNMKEFIGLLLLIPFLIGYYIWMYRLCRHMPHSDEKLSFKDIFNNYFILWQYLIVTIAFAAFSLYFLFNYPNKWIIAVPGFIIFSFLAGLFIKLITDKKKHKKSSSSN